MVNEKTQSIDSIINILKNADKPVSGEELAENLGVSRVAVWKTVNRLKQDGYNIESSRSGYWLKALTDKPLPRELNRHDESIRYFDELDSTMKKARLLLENGCSDGTTIIAGMQTAGISREGGRWNSPSGGLYFTRIRTRPLPLLSAGIYCTALTATVAETIRNLFDIPAQVRWPNEVTIEGRKLSGLLTSFSGELFTVSGISTGIGVNVNISAEALPENAVSIMQLTGRAVSIKDLLSCLLETIQETDSLFSTTDSEIMEQITNKCRKNMETLGRDVIIKHDGIEKIGKAVDLDSTGALLIKTGRENLISIYRGEDYSYV
ncbi:MAG: biotin--[acetyl-CoA-carboxylase] ligase [Spirochaetales bacterium]|nr:biotin--[acetyl-CoA-carboxylase] ligase [Spirochaetales bacterium]